ncbi:hypothetical protein DSECCO2_395720 [anaerobic digester metagenome]
MKHLKQFNMFDFERFSKGKVYVCVACQTWKDYTTDQVLGTVVEVAIVQDDTPYKQKDGEQATNLYEKLKFKVSKDISVPINTKVSPVNPICTIYGDYANQLSVKCEDIRVVSTNATSVTITPQNTVPPKPVLAKTP